jgi:MurNAc alpha-1-phosphate uridylyltransferase
MRPLTYEVPKPLLEVHGRTLLEHQIDFLKNYVDSIAVTIGYMSEKVSQRALQYGADYIFQNNLGGNANWLNSSFLRNLQAPIIVITCDNLMDVNLTDVELESQSAQDLSYLVTRIDESDVKGDRILQTEGRVIAISQDNNITSLATGLQIINPGTLSPEMNFDNFHEVWSDLISKESLHVSRSQPTKWVAIDTILDLENANKVN